MAAKAHQQAEPKLTQAQEKLWYFAMLRQMEAQSEATRAAYKRLAASALDTTSRGPQTVILDWLEAELGSLRKRGDDRGATASQLMTAAVALANALKQ